MNFYEITFKTYEGNIQTTLEVTANSFADAVLKSGLNEDQIIAIKLIPHSVR